MTDKIIRWGILSTANIAEGKLIPAIHASGSSEVVAVASRSIESAQAFATRNQIPTAYGDYQSLLDDPDVDAIYIPLPNHLHVSWSIKAIEAGKHVLCEKPIGMDVADTEKLIAVASQHPHLKVMEAFMYRFNPQWAKARSLLQSGVIGEINSMEAVFTYFNRDPDNVRNLPGIGGGGLMDIGCYCISSCRYLFETEPGRVVGQLEMDEGFGVDKHTHGILEFPQGSANIYCSTQSESSQRVSVSGSKGRMTIRYPFYQPDDCLARITVTCDGVDEVIEFPECDQYVFEVDAFANAIVNDLPVPTPLSDALANMKVIDAIFVSHKNQTWVDV